MRRAYTVEQLREVDLPIVHEHVAVDIRCRADVPLADTRTDLGPAHPLVMEQTDSPMTKIVRTECRHSGVAAGAADSHAQAVGRDDWEERCFGVAIFARRLPPVTCGL